MKIHFFHTNDVHSHFEEYLQIATQLRRRREQVQKCGETAFTFDIGDHCDRKRLETEGTYGRTNGALLREMRYDAWTFGNNEGLTFPRERFADMVNEAGRPVLVANLFDDETRQPLPLFEPYIIFERAGIRIAVLGLTVPFFDFYKMFGIYAEHPRETFARLMPEIRQQNVDLVVLLSHLGLSSDRQIAGEVEGIDLILGGHSHHLLEKPERVGETWICQAECYGTHFGHVEIDWDETARQIRSVTGEAVPRDPGVTPDADLQALLEEWQERAASEMAQTVTRLQVALPHELDVKKVGRSAVANVLTDGMRRLTGAPIAMINAGMFNHGLAQGVVTRADLLSCFPSPSLTCVVELTGAQILSVLKKSLDPNIAGRAGKGYGFRGHLIGGLQVSGLQIEVWEQESPSNDEDSTVNQEMTLQVWLNGQLLHSEQSYEVAATDYLYFSPTYEEFKQGKHVRFELPFLRELFGQELAKATPAQAEETRWKFMKKRPLSE